MQNNPPREQRRPLPPTISDEQVKRIRQAARTAAEKTSLRTVAAAIGIGHSTLHNFLNEARPHPKVRGILYDWYVQQVGPGPLQPSDLDALLRELPDHTRQRIRPLLAQILVLAYLDGAVELPDWLAGM